MLGQPLGGYRRHHLVCVVHAIAGIEAEGEGMGLR
jgi:hypothetical protein